MLGELLALSPLGKVDSNLLVGTESPRDVTFFIRNKLNNAQRMTVYVSRGLSDGSPDWAVGVMMKFYP